jgi:hypothetical protein
MTRKLILAALALFPAAALAQTQALEAARGAKDAAAEGNARVERAADAQLANGADAERAVPAGDPEKAAAAPADGDIAVAPLEGGAAAADAGRGSVPPPDTYTIRPGDTLWDLSGRFLNNPWYWPKVWSYNPEISNPHWIEPGGVIKFYPSAEEAPARVEPVEPVVAGAEPEPEEDLAPVRELEDLSRADLAEPPSAEEQDVVAVAGPYKIGYAPKGTIHARRDTFVTPRELAESGAIKAAFEEKLMLSTHDRAYAQFRGAAGVKPGETYVVYKTERPIEHPVTKELIGYQSTILGAAQVIAVDDKAATLVIGATNEPIERGALLGPWTERFFRPVAARPNARDLKGVIVASPVSVLTQFAENQVVFIDRGRVDGVEEGNRFTVVRSGDPYGRAPGQMLWDGRFPKEDVGDLLVVDVRESASAALVTRSLVELEIGDRVEMRAAGGAGGN